MPSIARSTANVFFVAGIIALASCRTPEEFYADADREAYSLVAAARAHDGHQADPDFTIEPGEALLRKELLFPRPNDGRPGPAERLAREGGVVSINYATALAIAARNSRDYQSQKELLYSTALDLTQAVDVFENQYFGIFGTDFDAVGDGDNDADVSLSENGALGFTRMLESGGSFQLSIGENLSQFLTNPTTSLATTLLNFTLSLPILQGAGRLVAFENVTQSERDVLYAVRSFERFKRVFAVDILSDYLDLLLSAQTVTNNETDLKRRQRTAAQNELLGLAGRIARTDVERVNQTVLSAENSLVNARQGLENALDRFKVTLGLPPDARLEVDIADLARLVEQGASDVGIDEVQSMMCALKNRLDFATAESNVVDAKRQIHITKNGLEAGLDFSASYNGSTPDFAGRTFEFDPIGNSDLNLGFDLDLPLERTAQRNAYRRAVINLNSQTRNAELFEDQVKLQARFALRSLERAQESYRIALDSRRVALINEDAAQLLKASGDGTTNDLVDAQNDLIRSENGLVQSLISYRVALLSLYRDLGVLVVGPDGVDEELTLRLLNGDES